MTPIRDASLTTARRRQLALYTWRSNNQTLRAEQRASNGNKGYGFTADVAVAALIGAQLIGQSGSCACSTAVTLQGYDKKSPGN